MFFGSFAKVGKMDFETPDIIFGCVASKTKGSGEDAKSFRNS